MLFASFVYAPVFFFYFAYASNRGLAIQFHMLRFGEKKRINFISFQV